MTSRNALLFNTVVSWDEIPMITIRPGVRRQVYSTDDVMVARHELEAGMTPRPHTHANFDQLVYIAEGTCHYYVGGTPHRMAAGMFLLVPRGSEHYVEPIGGLCVNIDIFVPPRTDMMPPLPAGQVRPAGLAG